MSVTRNIVKGVVKAMERNVEFGAAVTEAFEFEMQTTSADESFTIPCNSGTFDAVVDWGDGTTSDITTFDDADLTHTYSTAGTYLISVTGTFPNVDFGNDATSAAKVVRVTNLGKVGWTSLQEAFFRCVNMVSFVSGNCDTSAVTRIDSMFRTANLCASFNVSTMDVSAVTRADQAFRECSVATSLNLSAWSMPLCTNISFMFYRMFDAVTIQLPLVDQGTVTTMSNMCFQCTDLENIDLDRIDTSGCNRIDSLFRDCENLASVDTSSMDTSAVTRTDNAFDNIPATDVGASDFDIGLLTNAANMFLDSAMTTFEYDALLVAWEGQSHQNNVTLHAGSSTYTAGSAAATARAALVTDGWTITDLGGIGVDLSSIKDYVSTGSEGTFATCEFNDPTNPVSSGVEYRARLIISGLTEGGFNLDFPSGGLTSTTNGTSEAFLTPGFAGTVRLRTAGSQPNAGATCSVVIQEYVAP